MSFIRKTAARLLSLLLILGVVAFALLRYHFILLDNNIKILKKTALSWQYTFVDARGARRYKLILNPELVKSGLKDLIQKEGEKVDK
jgi:hypothetical protein